MAKIEEYAEKFEIKEVVITLIISSLGFFLAFWWRDIIKETIETYLPSGEGLIYKYGIAFLVTLIVVMAIYILVKIKKANIIPDEFEEKLKRKTIGKLKKK